MYSFLTKSLLRATIKLSHVSRKYRRQNNFTSRTNEFLQQTRRPTQSIPALYISQLREKEILHTFTSAQQKVSCLLMAIRLEWTINWGCPRYHLANLSIKPKNALSGTDIPNFKKIPERKSKRMTYDPISFQMIV